MRLAGTPIYALLTQAAQDEGFPLMGAVDFDLAEREFREHVERYDRWLGAGYDGAMAYLRRGRDRRSDPRQVLASAQSVFCVAQPYPASPAGSADPAKGPRYARYLRRNDYHEDIAARLERVMRRVARELGSPLEWKVCVDTSAVLERSWAALAGLGWIGKNTLLIHPKHGSYLFLGEVLLSERTGQAPRPLPNYCGNCRRCLEDCPTRAFEKPGVLDSNRCISYWTLEKRGELPIGETDRRAVGTWIAGCDVCQEVCPFNTKPARAAAAMEPPGLDDGATSLRSWAELLSETEERYRARVRESSLSRVKPAQFRRNLAVALANAILDATDRGWVEELKPQIARRLQDETDPIAKTEWKRCWDAAFGG